MAIEKFGSLVESNGERVFVTRGIFDYMSRANFELLCRAYREAQKNNAKLFVGLYSNAIIRKAHKKNRDLEDVISDEDRVHFLEAFDLVDGAFIIDRLDKKSIMTAFEHRLLQKRHEAAIQQTVPIIEKKYEVGYASGGFSNLHKGHIEHLEEMRKQCKTVIVAANSDNLIQGYKHKKVTIDEETRRKILSHVRFVDLAIITDEYDKTKAIDRIRELIGKPFNAIFVGSDWKGDPKWNEFEKKLNTMGIDVVFTDRPQNGISTTKIEKSRSK